MGIYSLPESIRQFKPKGTMVKNISGHYYVCSYLAVFGVKKRNNEEGNQAWTIHFILETFK